MKTIIDYLGAQLKGELDRLWADGTLNEEKVESFRTLHERTPYHKAKISGAQAIPFLETACAPFFICKRTRFYSSLFTFPYPLLTTIIQAFTLAVPVEQPTGNRTAS